MEPKETVEDLRRAFEELKAGRLPFEAHATELKVDEKGHDYGKAGTLYDLGLGKIIDLKEKAQALADKNEPGAKDLLADLEKAEREARAELDKPDMDR